MNLPEKYKWLLRETKRLPRTIELALREFGVQEVVGKGSNKTIIGWRDELNQNGVKITGYSDDDIPWCGLFVAIITFRRAGIPAEVVESPLWARSWSRYGNPVRGPAVLGDVLVFSRNGGGHVGFYIGEDEDAYHVLGGNQGNKVCITRIAKNRCISVRRPPYNVMPKTAKVYKLSASGSLSKNEA